MSTPPKKEKDVDPANSDTLAALVRLSAAMKDLDPTGQQNKESQTNDTSSKKVNILQTAHKNALHFCHWRDLPSNVKEAYHMMSSGAELLNATSTKYTLMGKASPDGGFGGLAEEMRKACEIIGTGALLLHSSSTNTNIGCGQSCRTHVRSSVRNVLACATSLVQSFQDGTAIQQETIGAQKTGAVWNSCDALSKIPKGNRASVRRDLLIWARDCNETISEFQEILDLGPTERPPKDDSNDDSNDNNDDEAWDDFCCGDDEEQYTAQEIKIVDPSLSFIKCSRGTIGVTLSACECAGDAMTTSSSQTQNELVLRWISTLCELIRLVGVGATDLGAKLYPPLDCDDALIDQLRMQRDALITVNDYILATASNNAAANTMSNQSPLDGGIVRQAMDNSSDANNEDGIDWLLRNVNISISS